MPIKRVEIDGEKEGRERRQTDRERGERQTERWERDRQRDGRETDRQRQKQIGGETD